MGSIGEISHLCRLCLVKEQVNIPIFEEQGDIRQIFLKICSCLPVKITKEDSLPKKICDGCSQKLDSFYQFWKESSNSEKQLLAWLNNSNFDVNTITNQAVLTNSNKSSDTLILKQEIVDINDSKNEGSSIDYLLQQQQLPYQQNFNRFSQQEANATVTSEVDLNDEPPPAKRKKRAAPTKKRAKSTSDSEEDDDLDAVEAKVEGGDSDDSDNENDNQDPDYIDDSSHLDDQPGPSGVTKNLEAPSSSQTAISKEDLNKRLRKELDIKSCRVILEKLNLDEIQLAKSDGRRKTNFICYICSAKFRSKFALATHKHTHSPEEFEHSEDESEFHEISFAESEVELETETDTEVESNSDSETGNKSNDEAAAATPSKTSQDSNHNKNSVALNTTNTVVNYFEKDSLNQKAEEENSKTIQFFKVAPNSKIWGYFFKCTICKVYFKNEHNLNTHILENKYKNCEYLCIKCNKPFIEPIKLKEHMAQHFGKDLITPPPSAIKSTVAKYNCNYCPKIFDDCFQLRRHTLLSHNSKDTEQMLQPQTPAVVKPVTVEPINLEEQVVEHIEKDLITTPPNATNSTVTINKYNCNLCSKNFDDFFQIRRHTLLSHNIKVFKETLKLNAPKVVKPDPTKLEEHMTQHVEKDLITTPTSATNSPVAKYDCNKEQKLETYTCNLCFDVFKTVLEMKEHLELHEEYQDITNTSDAATTSTQLQNETPNNIITIDCDKEDSTPQQNPPESEIKKSPIILNQSVSLGLENLKQLDYTSTSISNLASSVKSSKSLKTYGKKSNVYKIKILPPQLSTACEQNKMIVPEPVILSNIQDMQPAPPSEKELFKISDVQTVIEKNCITEETPSNSVVPCESSSNQKVNNSIGLIDTDNDEGNLVIDERTVSETNCEKNESKTKESSNNAAMPKIFVRSLSDLMEPPKKKRRYEKSCSDCNHIFNRFRSFRIHNKKKEKCTKCEYTNCRINSLKIHYLNEHSLFLCTRCKLVVDNVSDLNRHNVAEHTCKTCFRVVHSHENHKSKCTGIPPKNKK